MTDVQFSAKFDRNPIVGRPTQASARRVRDVLICVTSDVETDEFRAHPPIGFEPRAPLPGMGETATRLELGRGVSIERLSDEDSELVMNACTARGHFFFAIRQFGQRYSLVREVDLADWEERPFRWDSDDVIWDALVLSRLVRDNAYSTDYAARLVDFEDGEQQVIYTLLAESRHVYRVRRDRDWLDVNEGRELADLLATYWRNEESLPERVVRAKGRTEYASWMRAGALIIPILVSGLEALLKTERHPSTRQFVVRCAALGDELGIDVSSDLLERMYDARSEWIHGTEVQLFTVGEEAQAARQTGTAQGPQTADQRRVFEEIALLQDLARRAVRRCIEDEEFRAVFADDDRIRERWPLPSA